MVEEHTIEACNPSRTFGSCSSNILDGLFCLGINKNNYVGHCLNIFTTIILRDVHLLKKCIKIDPKQLETMFTCTFLWNCYMYFFFLEFDHVCKLALTKNYFASVPGTYCQAIFTLKSLCGERLIKCKMVYMNGCVENCNKK